MKTAFKISLFASGMALISGNLFADHHERNLYKDAVAPVLMAKCAGCHGEEKQKGKLRLDSLEAVMKGGSEGVSVVPGKIEESSFVQRLLLPLDDDERMPPEGKDQLTKEELAVLSFWVKSGAKGDATVAALKPDAATDAAIKAVFAAVPKAGTAAPKEEKPTLTPEQIKAAEQTIAVVEKTGASLMAIAQDTPELRFSALNVAKEFGDKNLGQLKPVADQIKWVDVARTQVTDAGLAQIAPMKNLTRLHLENTKISDAGLDHLKGLGNLEYLNLYGTQVTDAGIMKLAGLKNLKKLFVWQSKVTDAGAKKLAAAIPGINVNTGWKAAPAKPVVVAAADTKKPAPPAPTKPAPKPTTPPKPAPKPTTPPKPAPKPTTPPKPAAKPAPAPAPTASVASLQKALAELKLAAADAKKKAGEAKVAADAAAGKVAAATKVSEAAKANAAKADALAKETQAAVDQLQKVIEMTGKK